MSTQDNPTPDPLPGEPQLSPAGGEPGAVDTTALSLAELNQYLGKDFKDVPSALKSLKDTQAFVGKRKEDIEKEVRASLGGTPTPPPASVSPEVQSLSEEVFYLKNPQFKGYENIIRKMGSNPAEVVESEEFKSVFEKGKVADEVARSKSVAPSNSRLGSAGSLHDEAVKTANATHSTEATADVLARGIAEELNAL
jgi:hypothetical protein